MSRQNIKYKTCTACEGSGENEKLAVKSARGQIVYSCNKCKGTGKIRVVKTKNK